MTETDEWEIGCSDDEKYYEEVNQKNEDNWLPPSLDIIELFEQLQKYGYVELEWNYARHCPLSPIEQLSVTDIQEVKSPTVDVLGDFDFDEEQSQLKVLERRNPTLSELKGSARKRTVTLDSIMSNMIRHKQLASNQDVEKL